MRFGFTKTVYNEQKIIQHIADTSIIFSKISLLYFFMTCLLLRPDIFISAKRLKEIKNKDDENTQINNHSDNGTLIIMLPAITLMTQLNDTIIKSIIITFLK